MLDKTTTAVVTAIQLFDKLDHIHCWQLWNFSSSSGGTETGVRRSKISWLLEHGNDKAWESIGSQMKKYQN